MSINKRAYHPPELKKYQNVETMPFQQRAIAKQILQEGQAELGRRKKTLDKQERRPKVS